MAAYDKKLGIVGGGNMGEAFAGALIEAGIFEASSIIVSDVLEQRREALRNIHGVKTCQDSHEAFDSSDVVILAVKPQQMTKVLSDIAGREGFNARNRKLVVSIAAGVTMAAIEKILYAPLDGPSRKNLPIIRVMPNTPCLVLKGMSGMSANRHALSDEIDMTRKILGAMGEVRQFEEKQLDAVTGLSGSGPAYVFYLIESMIEAGVQNGLSREDASALTLQTVSGAVELMKASGETAEQLRKKVTSPGGTTEAAFKVLEKHGVKAVVVEAVTAAARRATELSG